jgi:magnesium transporter
MNPTAALLEPEVVELIRARSFAELREILHSLPPADVADILSQISPEEAAIAFRVLPRPDAGEVFAYMSPERQEELIRKLGDSGEGGAVALVEAMDPDDRVRLLDELPSEVAQRIVNSLSPEERRRTQVILGYPPKSVGRLMTPDYVRVRPEWTVARALEHVRRWGRDAETINVVYVIDPQGVLIDDLRLRQLIVAEPDQTIESLMNRQFVALRADQPQEEAVELLLKYDRVALPVVDSNGVLLGIVTHDDLADVAQREATEDMQRMAAVAVLEEPFMSASVWQLFSKRAPWLALLFMSELLTSNAIGFFEEEIQRAAILAAFIPAIISSGGNSGSQAATLVIRSLGLKEIGLGDWFRVLRREFVVAMLLGLLIGLIGLARINLFGVMGWFRDPNVADHFFMLGITIGVSLLGVVLWGSIMGAMLPFIMKRLGFDPAGSSTPFVATLVDVTGIVIYFTVAILILSTTLLRADLEDPGLPASVVVEVVGVENFREGDILVDLTVRTPAPGPAADGSAPPAHLVSVPLKALPDQRPPAPGDRLRLEIRSRTATAAERAPAPQP